jgi:hypothetical protein
LISLPVTLVWATPPYGTWAASGARIMLSLRLITLWQERRRDRRVPTGPAQSTYSSHGGEEGEE